jgi:hypothetical protein
VPSFEEESLEFGGNERDDVEGEKTSKVKI